jgi:peptidyl-prolyl cis-trans isomerase C
MNWARFCFVYVCAACLYAQTSTPSPSQPPSSSPARVVVTPGTATVAPPATVVPPGTVVLTVGDEKITAGEFDQLIDALPEQARAQVRGARKRQFADQLVQVKIMYQEAHRRKLDENPTVQRQIELQKENLLASLLLQDMTANAQVDDTTAQQYYEQHKADYESVHARHILIRVKGSQLPIQPGKKELNDEEGLAKAQEIRKKLVAGEDFAELAKAESDDVRSGANGGDLGSLKHNQTMPAFDKAVLSLPAGQLSEPVKTPYGYHLIKVEQHEMKSFAEVKADVAKKVRPELAHSAMENLQKQTTVVLNDSYFGPAPAPPAPVLAAPVSPAPASK